MDTKRCSRCGEQLPLDSFSRSYTSKDGYTKYCRSCAVERKSQTLPPKKTWPEGHRACTKCEQIKSFEEFHKSPKGFAGLASVCIACRSQAKPKPQAREGYLFCSRCGEEKPATAEYYYIDTRTPRGFSHNCRQCNIQLSKIWREEKLKEDPEYIKKQYYKHQEKNIKRSRAYYYDHHTEIRQKRKIKYQEALETNRAIGRRYYAKNRSVIIAKVKQWRQDNPERYREYNRQWAEDNPEIHKIMVQASWQRRRARKKNLPNNFAMEEWQYCLEYWQFQCAVCGNHEDLHADHWIALSREDTLGTVAENMLVLCQHCNQTKHVIEPKEWLIRKLGEEAGLAKLAEIEAYFQHLHDRKNSPDS